MEILWIISKIYCVCVCVCSHSKCHKHILWACTNKSTTTHQSFIDRRNGDKAINKLALKCLETKLILI